MNYMQYIQRYYRNWWKEWYKFFIKIATTNKEREDDNQ